MSDYMMGFFPRVDAFVYGRKSYELMISYWPQQQGEFADIMHSTRKYIYSRTLEEAGWNATILSEKLQEEMTKLKNLPGKDIVLFAGANLAGSFIKNRLIDEFRLIINPVVLGAGTPLFGRSESNLPLKLLDLQTFRCGNTLLVYEPEDDRK
jgi:dihydrofolate reductase